MCERERIYIPPMTVWASVIDVKTLTLKRVIVMILSQQSPADQSASVENECRDTHVNSEGVAYSTLLLLREGLDVVEADNNVDFSLDFLGPALLLPTSLCFTQHWTR